MRLLEAAGLPPGVINLVTGDGMAVSEVVLAAPGAGRHPLHRLDRDLPAPVAPGRRRTSTATAATRGWSARPAARTSSSRTPPPTSTCCAPRWSAARSSTRARSARPPPGPTCRARSGRGSRTTWSAQIEALTAWATSPTCRNFIGAVIDERAFDKHVERDRPAPGRPRHHGAGRRPVRRQRGLLRPADRAGVRRPGPTRCSPPSTSARSWRCTSTTTQYDGDRCGRSTRSRRTR